MTTSTYATPIDNTSDAGFRAWGKEASDAMTAVGFPKSADTGQINWASVTRPGSANTAGGYEIRYLDDALHSTFPIYVKIEYGTGIATANPSMWVTVGTGTNGAGTITGIVLNRSQGAGVPAPNSTVTNYPSYFCAVEGFFGMALKVLFVSGNATLFTLAVKRSTDDSSIVTSDAISVAHSTSGAAISCICKNLSTGFATADSTAANYSQIPYAFTTALVSGGVQMFPHAFATPRVRRCQFTGTVLTADLSGATQLQATPVGVVERNYINTGALLATGQSFVFMWE